MSFLQTNSHKDVVSKEKGQRGKRLLEMTLKELPCAVSHDEQQKYDLNPNSDYLHRFRENLNRPSIMDHQGNLTGVAIPAL